MRHTPLDGLRLHRRHELIVDSDLRARTNRLHAGEVAQDGDAVADLTGLTAVTRSPTLGGSGR